MHLNLVSVEPATVIMKLLVYVFFPVAVPVFAQFESNNFDKISKDSFISTLAEFTQSIYVHLSTTSKSENFIFSPLSLHSALSLLYLAAKQDSDTQKELAAAMGKITSSPVVTSAYTEILQSYKNESQRALLYGNHIWVSNQFSIDDQYREAVVNDFDTEISNLNFQEANATAFVNDWVKKITKGNIEKLVETFTADTQMFLANAVYFKDKWLYPFEEYNFRGEKNMKDFDTGKSSIKVPMVWQESDEFIYGEIDTQTGLHQVVTIPFESDQFDMQIILPEEGKKIEFLENEMKLNNDRDLFGRKSFNLFKLPKNNSADRFEEIHLQIPPFVVKSKFDLAEALQSFGAKQVFTSGAELDKITAAGPVNVGNILHEAKLEVTKDGSEAAAATGIELTLFSAAPKKHVTVNRPFIFIIQDRFNNIPVVVGRIKDPTIKLP